jgi:hypothetical protein
MIQKFFSDEEQVTFYPTYGYKEGAGWKIPLRIWVREPRSLTESIVTKIAASIGKLEQKEIGNFRSRIADLVADDESGETVIFKFDGDPDNEEYRGQSENGSFPKSDLNGLVEGFITLAEKKAENLLQRQNSRNEWLTFRAVSKEHSGIGRVRLLATTGRSVISDIDDTIKVTEIPAGPKVVVRNTFFRDFAAAPGMAARYQQELGAAAFHYVSGGPWQMYRPLAEFLIHGAGGFPEGSFHMKNIRKNLLSADTWEDLREIAGGDATFEQKVEQISDIITRFPGRKFVLIGDSGEKDPEVYREIRSRFPNQVEEIRIRDVVNDRVKNPNRLQGMTIIPV